MGYLHIKQGRLLDAEPYVREALATRHRVLGDEHRATLDSLNDLGALLEAQGRVGEAEEAYRRALGGRRRILGDRHPETHFSIDDLGTLLESQGRLAEAEPYYREVLASFRRAMGDEHPHTLASITSLASLLHRQICRSRRVLERRRKRIRLVPAAQGAGGEQQQETDRPAVRVKGHSGSDPDLPPARRWPVGHMRHRL